MKENGKVKEKEIVASENWFLIIFWLVVAMPIYAILLVSVFGGTDMPDLGDVAAKFFSECWRLVAIVALAAFSAWLFAEPRE
ncbi:MAG: hypothetical protein LBQ52_04950 [Helicobacteraceae bacterium]|jgi:hypothetical protein|nr:hypothetical protein [Helicobacteraceae bacterium]